MKNITLRFNVEIDGETFAKVAKCLKVYEPEIFSKMHEQFKPQFDKILNEGIRESDKSVLLKPKFPQDRDVRTPGIID